MRLMESKNVSFTIDNVFFINDKKVCITICDKWEELK